MKRQRAHFHFCNFCRPGTVRIRRWFPRESGQVCLVEIAQFSTQQDWPRGSRWLDGKTNQGDAVGPDANILSFLGGPKTCLRWRFAVLEMQVIYCELVRKFAFAAPDNEPPQTRLMTALLPMDSKGERPLPLRITRVL
ncbi:hypothetical protein B0H16DRAFT_551664 [Mycena metata]|uniref:Cytochrome P450 n=1 Tax=Mycena metata TaxID=1033252 RepID=A0AAD7H5L1_9AGAR|nr:hypothetical protein B0H16DRAFT_551664 [Mycena metata]